MKQKWLSRALSLVMLAAFVPSIALADTWNLDDGDITVSATADGSQTVFQGGNSKQDTDPTVTGGGSTGNTITINAEADATANVTLEDVNIDASNTGSSTHPFVKGDAAITVRGEGDVNLKLKGENTVSSGYECAGVEKDNKGELTIGSASGEGSEEGKLEANGGMFGAGIGGGYGGSGDNISITGGTITANGNEYAAGIGGGNRGNGSNITISGGNVTANGSLLGAGIGGGLGGDGTDIEITGGKVEASSKQWGAGIGGGAAGGDGSNISISGDANVKANGGIYSAGIGGGTYTDRGSLNTGDGSNISISGNARVEVKGGTTAAAIGGGAKGNGSNVSVSEGAIVKVSAGKNDNDYGDGAPIGNGGDKDGQGNPINGEEIEPNIDGITTGRIEYYRPGADFDKDTPYKILPKPPVIEPEKPAETDNTAASARETALYRVTDLEGSPIPYKAERDSGTLTLTVTADGAILTGTLGGLQTLVKEGVREITLTNGTDSATFRLAELIAKGKSSDTYALTLQKTPTLTLNGETVEL